MSIASTLLTFIDVACDVYILIIFARVLASWIKFNPYGKIYQFIFSMTEPPLSFIRSKMPRTGMLDFSPMILMFGVIILQKLLMTLVYLIF